MAMRHAAIKNSKKKNPQDTTLEDRLWSYVDKTEGCWLWTGAKGKGYDTYGRFTLDAKNTGIRVHRLIFKMLVGPIPDGMELLHACDTPCCVNPAHLRIGTHAENMADMKKKGRSAGRYTGLLVCQKNLHPLSGDNLLIRKNGARLCKICRKETEMRWNKKIADQRKLAKETMQQPMPQE